MVKQWQSMGLAEHGIGRAWDWQDNPRSACRCVCMCVCVCACPSSERSCFAHTECPHSVAAFLMETVKSMLACPTSRPHCSQSAAGSRPASENGRSVCFPAERDCFAQQG